MEQEELQPKDQPLTKADIKTLESMFIQSGQEMRSIVSLIELGLWKMYRDSKDFRKLVKLYGSKADAIVQSTVHEQLTKDETYRVGHILQLVRQLANALDQLSAAGTAIEPTADDRVKKECQMWDALQHDGKLLAWRHAMMCNIAPADDIKLDSTLKALAKDTIVSPRILDRLKANSEIL